MTDPFQMTVSYEVGGASHNGPLEIDFYVRTRNTRPGGPCYCTGR